MGNPVFAEPVFIASYADAWRNFLGRKALPVVERWVPRCTKLLILKALFVLH